MATLLKTESLTAFLHCTLLFFFSVYVYWQSTSLEFAFDDHLAIVNNPDVIQDRFQQIWVDDFWGRPMNSQNSHTSWRPLTILSFRLEYIANGGLNGGNFHTTNVFLHAIATVLVYSLALREVPTRSSNEAFLAAVVFAAHPVHVEAVTGVVGRAEILCAIFIMVTHLLLQRNCLVSSVITFIAALMTKEIAITYAGIVVAYFIRDWLYDVSLFCNQCNSNVAKTLVNPKTKKTRFDRVNAVCVSLIFAMLTFLYLTIRAYLCLTEEDIFKVGLGDSKLVRKSENPYKVLEPGIFKFLSLQIILLKYFELLTFPTWLSCEYSFNCLPMVESLSDERLLLILLMQLIFWSLIFFSLFEFFCNRDGSFFMALVWIGIPFSPSSHIFVTIGTLVAERLLYIPSIGFAILVARMWGYTNTRSKTLKRPFETIIVVLIAWYIHLTMSRIPDWLDDKSLFRANVEVCPQSAKSNLQYHQILLREGNITGAKFFLKKAQLIHPDWCDLDLHLGSIAVAEEVTRETLKEAVEYFIKSLSCLYTANTAMDKLQTIFFERQKAELLQGKKDPSLYYDIGRVNRKTANFDQALLHYKEGIVASVEAHTPDLGLKIFSEALELLNSGNVSEALLQNHPFLECHIKFTGAKLLKMTKKIRQSLTAYEDVYSMCSWARPGTLSEIAQLQLSLLQIEGETLENVKSAADALSRVLALGDGEPSDVQIQYLQEAKRLYFKCVSIASASGEKQVELTCLEKQKMIDSRLP